MWQCLLSYFVAARLLRNSNGQTPVYRLTTKSLSSMPYHHAKFQYSPPFPASSSKQTVIVFCCCSPRSMIHWSSLEFDGCAQCVLWSPMNSLRFSFRSYWWLSGL